MPEAAMTPPPALPLQRVRWRLATLFGVVGALASLALFPYLAAMMPAQLAAAPLPLPALAALQALRDGILCGVLGWIGLRLGEPMQLDAPWLRAWMARQPRDPRWRAHWATAALLGVGAALLVLGLLQLAPSGHAPAATSASGWAWRGLLASFYGGAVEEIECRLFLMTLIAWLLARLNRRVVRPWMMVAALILAAVLFGAAHLPAAFASGLAPSAGTVAHIVLLNASAGIVFGAMFWRWGLEHAMLAHLCADLVLHVAAPLLAG